MTIAAVLGVGLGLASGYYGGQFDMIVMRIADIQLALPAILTALLIDGIARGILPSEIQQDLRVAVLTLAIALSLWGEFCTNRAGIHLCTNAKGIRSGRNHNGTAPDPGDVCAYFAQHPWSAFSYNDCRSGLCHFT